MNDALTALMRPTSIGIVGASAKRPTRGNHVIRNLINSKFSGKILPIHPQASEMEGLPTVPTIEDLPKGVDLVFVAVPAPGVADVIRRLDRAGVRSSLCITAGFSPAEEADLREAALSARMPMHGPNCMGILNLSDSITIYTQGVSSKVKPGRIALLAQSGSAAIAVMNSVEIGFSKVVTLGSEFRVTAADYVRWLASDADTAVIGIILEAVQSPEDFADAVRTAQAAGKNVVVLKVGASPTGALAAQAHTGAMTTPRDAYEFYFRQLGVPMVADYEQLVATLECFASGIARAAGPKLGIVGISGGQTALGCDVATELGIPLGTWTPETSKLVRTALPGTTGRNPLDIGSSVGHEKGRGGVDALAAIAADPNVDILFAIQDMQETLPARLVEYYTHCVGVVVDARKRTNKPVILVSPTGDTTHPQLTGPAIAAGIPVLRGLRAGLVAARSLGAVASRAADSSRPTAKPAINAQAAAFKTEIRRHTGPLPLELSRKILAAYDIPFVRSAFLRSSHDMPAADSSGFPVVVKISSPDVPHRSDVGGVRMGIKDRAALRQAMAEIERAVRAAKPHAKIDGFEIQEELTGCVEALAGFSMAPPFGALTIVGSGGTLAELEADRAVTLGVVSPAEAEEMIKGTRLGRVLAGYRNLVPVTPLTGLARLIANLTRLAADLGEVLAACDINPVLVRKGSGEAVAVDILLIAA